MTQAGKVAEIFSTAGEAFTKLGQLAMTLQPSVERTQQDGGKWGEEEIEMLKKAVQQFGNDVEKISEQIRGKSAMQIKSVLKNKTIQNLTENVPAFSKSPITVVSSTQLHSSPIKTQQHAVQRIVGQKSKVNDLPILIPQQAQKKTKIDIPANMNILTAIPQIKSMTVRQNTTGLPIVASNQGFQVLLPQPQIKSTSSVMAPIMRSSIPGVSIIATSSVPSIPVGSIPVVPSIMQTIPSILPIVPTTITLSDPPIAGVSSIISFNQVQKIDNTNTSANVDVES